MEIEIKNKVRFYIDDEEHNGTVLNIHENLVDVETIYNCVLSRVNNIPLNEINKI
jgi:hypothetical protein